MKSGAATTRAIVTYIVLTFAGTWALWALVIRVNGPHAPANVAPVLALGGPVFLLGVFAPGIIAVAVTAWHEGRQAVLTLLGRVVRWRVGVQFYAFALLLMPITKLAVAVLHRVLTDTWPAFGETRPAVLLAATILSTVGQVGEEVGWRGFLLPRLTERNGLVVSSLVVGVVWAAWHLPLFFAPGADTTGQSFPLYTLQLVAYSVALAWLYWRAGGSLLLTMFMHAALNNTKDIVPSRGVLGRSVFTLDGTLVFRLTVLLLWLVAVILLLRMRGVSTIRATADEQAQQASIG